MVVVVWIGLLLGFVGFGLLGFVAFVGWFVASGGSVGGCSVISAVLNTKIKPKKILFYCVFLFFYIILLY